MRILLVEDDPMIGESIQEGLRQELYTVDWVCDGLAAEDALSQRAYDLMLLDLGLPNKDGLTLLAQYRRAGGEVPVLVTTARGETVDRIRGLDIGADDYLVKPFDIDEMYARVRALLRRRRPRAMPPVTGSGAERAGGSDSAPSPGPASPGLGPSTAAGPQPRPPASPAPVTPIAYRGLWLNPDTGEIRFKGSLLRLSGREYVVLRALLDPPGGVVSRERLESLLTQTDPGSHGNVDRDVALLRAKFGNDFIRSLSGSGFMIAPPQ